MCSTKLAAIESDCMVNTAAARGPPIMDLKGRTIRS